MPKKIKGSDGNRNVKIALIFGLSALIISVILLVWVATQQSELTNLKSHAMSNRCGPSPAIHCPRGRYLVCVDGYWECIR